MSRSIYAPVLFSLGFGFIGAFIVLFTPANAAAASDFDDTISIATDLSVGYDDEVYTITDFHEGLFRGFGGGGYPYASYDNSCDLGSLDAQFDFAISNKYAIVEESLGLRHNVFLYYSTNVDITAKFRSIGSGEYLSFFSSPASNDPINNIDAIILTFGGGSIEAYCTSASPTLASYLPSSDSHSYRPYLTNIDIVYPEGYEGQIVGDEPVVPEQLIPEYTWSINGETGELKVVYMKNISPFLTGTSYTVLEGMQPEFESPLTPIDSQSHLPAGWLDYSYTLQPGEGWYSLRIDHNQQLDQPPWDYTASTKPVIQQYFFQIYWDGKSSISGNNIGGCDGQICNNLRDTGSNKLTRFMNQLSFNTFGLESIIILPINYLAQTSSLVDSCQPIHVPFVAGSDFNIPCLRSTYMNAIPVLMGTVFVLINGLVMYLVAINTLRLVKNTADPDHDRIETTDL